MNNKNPILDLRLNQVIRGDIALPLQHVMQLFTVGQFLRAWKNPRNQRFIEQLFDTPDQARQAAAVCSGWIGMRNRAEANPVPQWWTDAPMSLSGSPSDSQ